MKVVFISNFLNHHQLPVAEELHRRLGDSYTFISTTCLPDSFLAAGYPDCRNFCFNLLAYQDAEHASTAAALVESADVVIIGAASLEWVRQRVDNGKLVLIYSERWFKDLGRHLFSLGQWRSIFKYHLRWRNKNNVSILCASAFLPNDLALLRLYKDRCYKWGYFTKAQELDIKHIIENRRNDVVDILWCSRFIALKKPLLPIRMAKVLKDKGFSFRLSMIGGGPLEKKMQRLIKRLDVGDYVSLLGNMSNDQVLKQMRNSSIFLFTSGREEGWGAVLGEAMASGCATVAGNMIGAAPYLIVDGENGFLFSSPNINDLTEKVICLLDDVKLRQKMSESAYRRLRNIWSPSNACDRLLELCCKLLQGDTPDLDDGPCSNAELFKESF